MKERGEQRAQAGKEELVEYVERAICKDGAANPMPGLHLQRNSSPLVAVHGLYGPALCMVAQGTARKFSSAMTATAMTLPIIFSSRSSCLS